MNGDFNKGVESVLNVIEKITELGGGIRSRQAAIDIRPYFLGQPDMGQDEYEERVLKAILCDMGASL